MREQLITFYVNESGMNGRDDYGYSPKGKRLNGMKSGGRKERINMIAGCQDGKLIAPIYDSGVL